MYPLTSHSILGHINTFHHTFYYLNSFSHLKTKVFFAILEQIWPQCFCSSIQIDTEDSWRFCTGGERSLTL